MRSIPWDDLASEIINNIDTRDTPTLLACSLTHPSWTLPAQRRLYRIVKILNREDMCRWSEFDAKDRFTSYVRHVIYYGNEENPLGPDELLEVDGGPFLGFNGLDTLELRHVALEVFDLDLFKLAFGHLGGTLRALLLKDARLTLNKVLELLNLFPRLHLLGLDCFTITPEYSQVPSELPGFYGTLNLSGPVDGDHIQFIEHLTETLPNFSAVRLRLNLSYPATRHLLGIPGFAKHVTTILLGHQYGKLDSPPKGTETEAEVPYR
jgi:hypothetical protein